MIIIFYTKYTLQMGTFTLQDVFFQMLNCVKWMFRLGLMVMFSRITKST